MWLIKIDPIDHAYCMLSLSTDSIRQILFIIQHMEHQIHTIVEFKKNNDYDSYIVKKNQVVL